VKYRPARRFRRGREDEELWDEKLREDAIRDQRLEVVRFTMADHYHQPGLLARYAMARARAARWLTS